MVILIVYKQVNYRLIGRLVLVLYNNRKMFGNESKADNANHSIVESVLMDP